MYPRTYYETFMRYEAKDEVFVAMPFSPDFKSAYERVIEPAIRRVILNKKRPLVPRIINRGTSGSPDIHEQIFDAILHSRLVIADMTVQASSKAVDGAARWQANANVAYEVGLAAAWRNPEDILLIYQGHPNHSYSFDVQSLRHVEYDQKSADSVKTLTDEIVRALNGSSFLGKLAYQQVLESVSPSAIQFMHEEARRAFPVVSFHDAGMPIMDSRIHATTELLACRALKNRNVIRQGSGKGIAVLYEWTELGLRMLESLYAVNAERLRAMRLQIASVAPGVLPPPELRDFPPLQASAEAKQIDMVEAAKIDPTNVASTPK